MKKFTTLAVSFVFAAIFAVSAFGQVAAQPGATKIGWLDTGMFGADKDGVTKYTAALKALENEMRPTVTDLTGIQTRLKAISDELQRPIDPKVPVAQSTLVAKQEEGQRLQREFEFKKKEYDAKVERRTGEVLGPVSADISRAIQEYAKARGYAVILDIDKLGQAGAILALDATSNITKEFIAYYNTRPATTATTATPR